VGLGSFSDLQDFVQQAQSLASAKDLHSLMESLIKELGFAHFALAHHVAILVPPSGIVRLHNYPDEWVETVVRRKYFAIDPVHIVSQRTAAGFHWSDFARFIPLSEPQSQMQSEARRAGLGNGFTVPINVPGEYTASVSYAAKNGVKFPHDSLPIANFLGPIAFEAARRIVGGLSRSPMKQPVQAQLTTRQLDCIALVAHGKSDVDIGTILDISPATVKFHVDSARERFDVSSRTQLVVRALFSNQLTFADILSTSSITLRNLLGETRARKKSPH